jgi:hypothetical protein
MQRGSSNPMTQKLTEPSNAVHEKVGDRTRAEWPLGERRTAWATPFQSLTTSRPAELVKWPMLIKREGEGEEEEAEHERREAAS